MALRFPLGTGRERAGLPGLSREAQAAAWPIRSAGRPVAVLAP
jgi:hypothetical protein